MKKILMSFLMMAMIAGCVQQAPTEAEKPEEPPVVEQPEKPVEQEKPEETEYVKKIDESKDWVYIGEEQIDHDHDFKLNSVLSSLNYSDFLDWLTLPFEEAPKKEKLIINIDSVDADILNELIAIEYAKPINIVYEFKWFMNEDIITIVNKWSTPTPHSLPIFLQAYHLDLKLGKVLTNEDLLLKYDLTTYDVQTKIDEFIKRIDFLKEDDSFITDQLLFLGNNYTINYNNNSLMFVENEELYCVVGYYSSTLLNNVVFLKIKLK